MREGVGSQNPLLQILCLRPNPQPVKQSSQWRKGPEDTGADSVCSHRGKPITAASSFTGCPALCHTLLKNILLLLGVVALLLGGGCVVVGWRVCCRVAGVLLSDGWCVVVGWQVCCREAGVLLSDGWCVDGWQVCCCRVAGVVLLGGWHALCMQKPKDNFVVSVLQPCGS